MDGIKSNSSTARQIATGIASSLDDINGGGTVITDTQTTVGGNTNAQEAIQSLFSIQNTIVQSIGQASNNLQSIANEFESADFAVRQIIDSLSIPSPTGR